MILSTVKAFTACLHPLSSKSGVYCVRSLARTMPVGRVPDTLSSNWVSHAPVLKKAPVSWRKATSVSKKRQVVNWRDGVEATIEAYRALGAHDGFSPNRIINTDETKLPLFDVHTKAQRTVPSDLDKV